MAPWLPQGSGFNVHIFYGQKWTTFFKEKATVGGCHWVESIGLGENSGAFFREGRKRSLTHVPEHLWWLRLTTYLFSNIWDICLTRKVPQPSVSAAAWTPAPKMGVRLSKLELTGIAAALRIPLQIAEMVWGSLSRRLLQNCWTCTATALVFCQIRKSGNYLCSCHLDICGSSQGGTAVSDLYRKQFQCAAINKDAIFKRNVIVKGSSPVLGSPFTDILTSGTALPYE